MKVKIKKQSNSVIEISNTLPFPQAGKSCTYNVETYILSPKSLKVTARTYSKEDFYKDFKNYIRFHISKLTFDKIVNPNGELDKIEQQVKDFFTTSTQISPKQLEESFKVLCINIIHALSESEKIIKKKSKKQLSLEEEIYSFIANCEQVAETCSRLKNYINIHSTQEKNNKKFIYEDITLSEIITLCENYILLNIKYYGSRLINILIKLKQYSLAKSLGRMIITNDNYLKTELKNPSLSTNDNNNEQFVQHYKLLKRYINSILFIDKSNKSDMVVGKQLIFSIAAGFSMVIATAITFFWQQKYGSVSLPVFLALVIGYILKDRIKDTLKEKGYHWLVKFFWDYRRKLNMGKNNNIGSYTESFYYMDSYKSLTPDIVKLIKNPQNSLLQKVLPELNIMFYQKQIKINKNKENILGMDFKKAMYDINRLSVSQFILKSDSSNKKWYNYDPINNMNKQVNALKTYNIIIICKCSKNNRTKLLKKFILKIGDNKIQTIQVII